tara:strand:+ start:7540 stop:8040 length:501 start_codon:yes stop_codon:yes gene_type:complete
MRLFGRKPKKPEEVTEEVRRYYSDILVNDLDAEAELGVQDYTRNPLEFLIDINNFPRTSRPLIKVEGLVAGLSTKPFHDLGTLHYKGFIIAGGEFPIFFEGHRNKDEIPNLKLEETMIKAATSYPIIMTGRIFFPHPEGSSPNSYYRLDPLVIQLGDYISPKPKEN